MRYYVIAGEHSGDLHAANLIRALKQLDPHAEFRGWGGDQMLSEGVELVHHVRDLAFMGFVEVVQNLRTIRGYLKECKADIRAWKPDVVIPVDYPGFNFRLLPFIHRLGIPIDYYISPQVWAWKAGRVKQVEQYCRKMLVIFPFEVDFYASRNCHVDFVGHPLIDEMLRCPDQGVADLGLTAGEYMVLMPGSRKQEIRRHLPEMVEAAGRLGIRHLAVPAVQSLPDDYYRAFAPDVQIQLVRGRTYDLLRHAKCGFVGSGTATVEAGLSGMPQIVCYRGGRLSYWIAKRLVNVKFIGMVNLIMDREIVPELIQGQMQATIMAERMQALLEPAALEQLRDDYRTFKRKLGGSGASTRAAQLIFGA